MNRIIEKFKNRMFPRVHCFAKIKEFDIEIFSKFEWEPKSATFEKVMAEISKQQVYQCIYCKQIMSLNESDIKTLPIYMAECPSNKGSRITLKQKWSKSVDCLKKSKFKVFKNTTLTSNKRSQKC